MAPDERSALEHPPADQPIAVSATPELSAIALFCFLGFIIYGHSLDKSPPYLNQDEVFFGVTAHSVARTGRDVNGDFLPLYFRWPAETSTRVFFQPALIYFTATFLKVLPVSEVSVRLPSVVVGVASIVLLYLVGCQVFHNHRLAAVAAALLLLTPAHVIHSRLAADYIYPLPFVLAWLWCLLLFLDNGRVRLLFLGGLALGLGFFTYIASVVMMPLYVALTCIVLIVRRRGATDCAIAALGFCLPLAIILGPWLYLHPEAVRLTAERYDLYAAAQGTNASAASGILESGRRLFRFFPLTERLSLYWSFFSPHYLFLTGAVNVAHSTRYVGVFLWPLAVLLPIGINQMLNARLSAVTVLILTGFVTAPLAACLVMEPYTIDRELELLPFAALIATFGIDAMLRGGRRALKAAAAVLLVAVPLQFAVFYTDYLYRYPARAGGWFGGNVRAGFDEIAAHDERDASRTIFLSNYFPYVDWHWRFYLLKYDRPELLERTRYVDVANLDLETVAAGSLILVEGEEPGIERLTHSPAVRVVSQLTWPSGSPFFTLLERVRS